MTVGQGMSRIIFEGFLIGKTKYCEAWDVTSGEPNASTRRLSRAFFTCTFCVKSSRRRVRERPPAFWHSSRQIRTCLPDAKLFRHRLFVTAHSQLTAILQQHHVVAVKPGLNLADTVNIDDC